MHMDTSSEPCDARTYRKNAPPQESDTPFVQACAVEMHIDNSEEPFCIEIYTQKEYETLMPRHPFRASLGGRNAHRQFRRAILYSNYTKNTKH